MKYCNQFLAVFMCLQISYFCQAQESILFSNDPYSGINSVVISPTQSFRNPNPWDINLLAENLFLQNDYGYVSQQSLLGLYNAEIQSTNIKKNRTGENTANVLIFIIKNSGITI